MRYFVFFLISFLIFPFSQGLELEADFVRTPGERGTFLFTVWPTGNLNIPPQQDYFIRSYPSTAHPIYRPVLDVIRSGGGVIVSPNQAEKVPTGARITTLGKTICETAFCFAVTDPNQAEAEFIAFAETSLPVVFHESLSAEWSDGFADVQFLNGPEVTTKGVSWVGRFTDDTDGVVTLTGQSSGESFVFPLSFSGAETFVEKDILALEEQWRRAHYGQNSLLLWFVVAWPWVLAGLCLGILLIGFLVTRLRRTKMAYSAVSLDACMDEVPLAHLDELSN